MCVCIYIHMYTHTHTQTHTHTRCVVLTVSPPSFLLKSGKALNRTCRWISARIILHQVNQASSVMCDPSSPTLVSCTMRKAALWGVSLQDAQSPSSSSTYEEVLKPERERCSIKQLSSNVAK